jgi:hypothetical protein
VSLSHNAQRLMLGPLLRALTDGPTVPEVCAVLGIDPVRVSWLPSPTGGSARVAIADADAWTHIAFLVEIRRHVIRWPGEVTP